jgi:kynureninase
MSISNFHSEFVPQPGALGYQLSNPSVLDINALAASLEIFGRTSMAELRQKSLQLTGYLERLLLTDPASASPEKKPFTIITPSNPKERGAQLSLRLQPGLLDRVLEVLEDNGVVVDERNPDVIRVTPAPLYNTYTDVWEFCQIFQRACQEAVKSRSIL